MANPKPPRRVPAGQPRRPERKPEPETPVETPAASPVDDGPATGEVEGGKLDLSDLELLASMNPDELAALMDGSSQRVSLEPGTKVTGKITRIGRDTAFIDLGGKSEGQLERGDLPDPDAKAGDEITAFVVRADDGLVLLTSKLTGAAAAEHLADAQAAGLPVEGKVESRNKGGFTVRVGPVRAFVPASQMSRRQGVDPDGYIGQVLQFEVLETGDRVVLSRRALQEKEAEEKARALWPTLEEGQSHRGLVTSVQPFGFFVDIGGVDGLVPKSEIGWGRIDDPRQVVKPGQAVEVIVLNVDAVARKLTLSAKALEDDPWSAVGTEFMGGGVYPGTVTNTMEFGVFVELAPGLEGLAHISRLAGSTYKKGDTLQVRLLEVDHDRRRLSLAPVLGDAEVVPVGAEVTGTVVEVNPAGVVLQLGDGRQAFLPSGEVALPPGTVLAQRFRRGREVTARILREDGSRVTVSLLDDPSEADRGWRQHQSQAKSSSFGTFGDLLKGLKLPDK
ncbi:MAG: S1 RNA-binding domain-containing protein [Myxococcota bacterium]